MCPLVFALPPSLTHFPFPSLSDSTSFPFKGIVMPILPQTLVSQEDRTRVIREATKKNQARRRVLVSLSCLRVYVLLLQVYTCKIWGIESPEERRNLCLCLRNPRKTNTKQCDEKKNLKAGEVLFPVIYGAQWHSRDLHWPAQPYVITGLPLTPTPTLPSLPSVFSAHTDHHSASQLLSAILYHRRPSHLALIPMLQMFFRSFHGGNSLRECHIIQVSAQLSPSQNFFCCLKWHLSVPFLVLVTL